MIMGQHGQVILDIQIQRRRYMDNKDKEQIIIDRINQIDIHIGLIRSSIDGGYLQKEGQHSFESILQDFILKKQALEQEKIILTNQD